MRSGATSPFVPGSGLVPRVWAGREAELADAEAAGVRRLAGVYDRGRAVLGEFGLGKSVLVNRVAQRFAGEGHWVAPSVRIPVGADPVTLLAIALRGVAAEHGLDAAIGRVASGLLERVAAFTLPVVGGGAVLRRPPDDALGYQDVLRLLEQVARLARAERRLLVVRVDEVQNITSSSALSRLLTVLGDGLEASDTERDAAGTDHERLLPLLVFLSGLPDFRDRVGRAGATFARRFKIHELEHLEEAELRGALIPFVTEGWPVLAADGMRRVHMDDGAVDLIVRACLGDPFLFQLAGEAAWNAGDGPVILEEDAARGWRLVRREVVRYVESRLGGLSDLQLAYLRTAAQIPEHERTGAAVAAGMGRPGSAALASTAQALDRTHGLLRREAGRVRFRSESVRAFLAGGWP